MINWRTLECITWRHTTRSMHSSTLALAASCSTNLSATLAKRKSGFHWLEIKMRMAPSVSLGFTRQRQPLPLQQTHTILTPGIACFICIWHPASTLLDLKKKLQLHHSYYYLNSSDTAKAKSSLSSLWSAVWSQTLFEEQAILVWSQNPREAPSDVY